MIPGLPLYISIVFLLTTILTFSFFIKAANSKKITTIVLLWIIVQTVFAVNNFFLDTNSFPPRFAFLINIPVITIIILFTTKSGRNLIDNFNPKLLTYMHVVRIPVEITLLWLALNKQVPLLMTFEGRNFDIFSGITASFVAWFGYSKNKLSKNLLLAWNIVCLILLFNIVINAVLSIPTPIQKFAFDQPNVGVLYFPFTLLPGFIVPAVLFAHLVCIRQLLRKQL